MPDPNTIPFKEASGNGHYESKQLPEDRADFLTALGLPTFAGDVVSATTPSMSGQIATYWGTDGHTIKGDSHTGIITAANGVIGSTAQPLGAVVGTTDAQTLTNKRIEGAVLFGSTGLTKADVGLSNVDNTSDANKPTSAATAATLATKEDKGNKGIVNGYSGLDNAGKVPLSQIPDAVIGASRYQGTWNAATNSPAIPAAIPANQGYYYNVAVGGSTSIDGISSWAIGDTIISNGSIWQKIPVANAVQSVNGKTGIVVVNKNDVALGNVDNTSDATKNSAVATLSNKTIDGASNTLNVRLGTTDVSGNLPVNKLNGGTAASATTYWRGDGQWVSPTGAGDVQGPAVSVDGEMAVYSGTTGKLLGRLPRSAVGDVYGPAGAVNRGVAIFDGTTGKLLKDGGAAPNGAIVGTTDTQDLSNKRLANPIIIPTPGTPLYRPAGVVYINTTVVYVIGASGNILHTFAVPAGLLAKNGDCLRLTTWMRTQGSAGTKTLAVAFGTDTAFNVSSASLNNALARITVNIFRTGPTAQLYEREYVNGVAIQHFVIAAGTQDLGTSLTLSVNGANTSGNNGDVNVDITMVEFLPAP